MEENKSRIVQLDSLRGIAALSVLLFHYTYRYGEIYTNSKIDFAFKFEIGHYGVQLFFIISGFVIYMSISKVNRLSEFVIKRFLRLYPAYIIAVTLTFVLVTVYGLDSRQVSFRDAIINFTMLQGFIPGISHVDGVYWTLTIELSFYFIIALFFLLSSKLPKAYQRIEVFAFLWMTVAIGLKIISYTRYSYITSILDKLVNFNYCNLFILGIMFYQYRNSKNKKYYVYMLSCIIYEFINHGIFSGILIICFSVLFYIAIFKNTVILNNKILKFFGTISYSLYLIHQNIGYIIIKYFENLGITSEFILIIPVCVSIGLAYSMTYLVERPIQNYFKHKIVVPSKLPIQV